MSVIYLGFAVYQEKQYVRVLKQGAGSVIDEDSSSMRHAIKVIENALHHKKLGSWTNENNIPKEYPSRDYAVLLFKFLQSKKNYNSLAYIWSSSSTREERIWILSMFYCLTEMSVDYLPNWKYQISRYAEQEKKERLEEYKWVEDNVVDFARILNCAISDLPIYEKDHKDLKTIIKYGKL